MLPTLLNRLINLSSYREVTPTCCHPKWMEASGRSFFFHFFSLFYLMLSSPKLGCHLFIFKTSTISKASCSRYVLVPFCFFRRKNGATPVVYIFCSKEEHHSFFCFAKEKNRAPFFQQKGIELLFFFAAKRSLGSFFFCNKVSQIGCHVFFIKEEPRGGSSCFLFSMFHVHYPRCHPCCIPFVFTIVHHC